MSRPSLTVATAENERVLNSIMEVFSRHGATNWRELEPPVTTFCTGPTPTDSGMSLHAFRAGPIARDGWAAAQADLVETAANQGFEQVVVLEDNEKYHSLDIWGPYDAVIHVNADSERTTVGIDSGCHPMEAPSS